MTQAPLTFNHATGRLGGVTAMERCAVLLLQAGALASSPMGHRGFSIGAKIVASLINQRDIVVQLNDDAQFAFPLGDCYWSLLLDHIKINTATGYAVLTTNSPYWEERIKSVPLTRH